MVWKYLNLFTVVFAVLLATRQEFFCTHGIAVLQFYDLTHLTRLCNNFPSYLQPLLNLLSNQLSLLMCCLPNSFRSLLISQRNPLNWLQSLVNLFSFLRTRSLYLHSSPVQMFTTIRWGLFFRNPFINVSCID